MESKRKNIIVEDWQSLVNKPVYSSNGKDIGIVEAVQPEFLITSFGSISKDKYLIPKTSIQSINNGILYIKEDSDFVEKNFKFE
ncbi:MAG TPA: PRC-barrel domain-containing protein [Nitrososphaeraceae archaeon]|jgi:sporulation protein YlmC with PRC-barrel domain|nr:PRC-barrel domain-containing protein [Nitrososphaeraceae archaeon]